MSYIKYRLYRHDRMVEESAFARSVGELIYGFALQAYQRRNFPQVTDYLFMLDEFEETLHVKA